MAHLPPRYPSALADLVRLGKRQGFLTYDQVNDLMPASVVSPEDVDVWVGLLIGQGIEVVEVAPEPLVDPDDLGAGTEKSGQKN